MHRFFVAPLRVCFFGGIVFYRRCINVGPSTGSGTALAQHLPIIRFNPFGVFCSPLTLFAPLMKVRLRLGIIQTAFAFCAHLALTFDFFTSPLYLEPRTHEPCVPTCTSLFGASYLKTFLQLGLTRLRVEPHPQGVRKDH